MGAVALRGRDVRPYHVTTGLRRMQFGEFFLFCFGCSIIGRSRAEAVGACLAMPATGPRYVQGAVVCVCVSKLPGAQSIGEGFGRLLDGVGYAPRAWRLCAPAANRSRRAVFRGVGVP